MRISDWSSDVCASDLEGASLVARDQAYAPGDRRRLDIYAPTTTGQAPRPVIVFFYGGSWKGGSKEGYGFVGRAFAAQGFVVAVRDYRLVPKVRFPAFVEHSRAAVKWVRAPIPRLGDGRGWGREGVCMFRKYSAESVSLKKK